MPVILPIKNKLKRKIHKDLALAQDLVVTEMYNNFPEAIMHGGTGIWRCYKGNRFSEDIDVYLPLKFRKSKELETFKQKLERGGFESKKFKTTENTIFAKFSYQRVLVSFEAVFKNVKKFVTKSFEMSDGSFIVVNTLGPEELIREKASAYQKRRKIRDLYDIFFLLNSVEDKNKVVGDLKDLIRNFKEPLDPKDLKTLIIYGIAPSIDEMVKVIKRWGK